MKIIKKMLKIIGIIVAALAFLYGVLYVAEFLMEDEIEEINNCLSEEERQYQEETTRVMETLEQPERKEYFCERDTKQLNRLSVCILDKKEKYPIAFFFATKVTSYDDYFLGMINSHNTVCPDMLVEMPSL